MLREAAYVRLTSKGIAIRGVVYASTGIASAFAGLLPALKASRSWITTRTNEDDDDIATRDSG
jgi:hypothetical protein